MQVVLDALEYCERIILDDMLQLWVSPDGSRYRLFVTRVGPTFQGAASVELIVWDIDISVPDVEKVLVVQGPETIIERGFELSVHATQEGMSGRVRLANIPESTEGLSEMRLLDVPFALDCVRAVRVKPDTVSFEITCP